MKYKKFQNVHIQFSIYSTPFVCFTFYVAHLQKKCKIINKKCKHNPGIRGAGGFKIKN